MNQAEIQQLFRRFAEPLSKFVSLGCSQDSALQLARNLWLAMIGGPEMEAEVWQAMQDSDSDLFQALQACYDLEMKPALGPQQLDTLRQHYGLGPSQPNTDETGTSELKNSADNEPKN